MNKLALTCMAVILVGTARTAQTATAPDQQLLLLAKEIQVQQAAISDNQAKIDAKLVALAEAVRVARIYASRGGH